MQYVFCDPRPRKLGHPLAGGGMSQKYIHALFNFNDFCFEGQNIDKEKVTCGFTFSGG